VAGRLGEDEGFYGGAGVVKQGRKYRQRACQDIFPVNFLLGQNDGFSHNL
jgi:hypothetical protein